MSDVPFVDVLRASVLGLEADTRIVRRLLGFLCSPAELRGIAEAPYRASESGQGAINLIFGTLHCQQIDQIQRRAVELLEHLMTATPLRKKPLADLPK